MDHSVDHSVCADLTAHDSRNPGQYAAARAAAAAAAAAEWPRGGDGAVAEQRFAAAAGAFAEQRRLLRDKGPDLR
eukprot:gene13143-biopygen3075